MDGKTNKGKVTKDRVQGIFNKGIRLQNGMNEVDQAFKPVIQQMFALHEFYQQVRILLGLRFGTNFMVVLDANRCVELRAVLTNVSCFNNCVVTPHYSASTTGSRFQRSSRPVRNTSSGIRRGARGLPKVGVDCEIAVWYLCRSPLQCCRYSSFHKYYPHISHDSSVNGSGRFIN